MWHGHMKKILLRDILHSNQTFYLTEYIPMIMSHTLSKTLDTIHIVLIVLILDAQKKK